MAATSEHHNDPTTNVAPCMEFPRYNFIHGPFQFKVSNITSRLDLILNPYLGNNVPQLVFHHDGTVNVMFENDVISFNFTFTVQPLVNDSIYVVDSNAVSSTESVRSIDSNNPTNNNDGICLGGILGMEYSVHSEDRNNPIINSDGVSLGSNASLGIFSTESEEDGNNATINSISSGNVSGMELQDLRAISSSFPNTIITHNNSGSLDIPLYHEQVNHGHETDINEEDTIQDNISVQPENGASCAQNNGSYMDADYEDDNDVQVAVNEDDDESSEVSEDENIVPAEDDVLLGQGGHATSHVGNLRFTEFCKSLAPLYIEAGGNNKIKGEIVIRAIRYVRRFLKKNQDGSWRDASADIDIYKLVRSRVRDWANRPDDTPPVLPQILEQP